MDQDLNAFMMWLRRLTLLLREIPGGVLVGEIVRKFFGGQRRVIAVDDFDGSLIMFLDLGEHMQSQIFWHGSYSRNIIILLRRLLTPGMVVIDGGANIGEISLVAAKLISRQGRVIAFEPVPAFADQLQRHADANDLTNLTVCRFGLSDRRGEASIYVADSEFRDGTRHEGLATLFPTPDRPRADARINLLSLDEFANENLDRVDLVKLDIEGGELAALQGASNLLRTQGPALIVEIGEVTCTAAGYEMADIARLISSYGYTIYRIGWRGRLTRIEEGDLLRFQNVYCVKEC